jgi:elongation factor P--(R)-beta-lysine ligase
MSNHDQWRPSADRSILVERAALLTRIRAWLARRGVLEVETPQLSRALVADRHIECLSVITADGPRWLQPSPEGAMKRLLAAGSGDIYQIARVFRDGEASASHNPEFTMVEWYRIGRSLHELIEEVSEFVTEMLEIAPVNAPRHRYLDLIGTVLNLDAREATDAEIRSALCEWKLDPPDSCSRAAMLDLAMASLVTPELGLGGLEFVTHFPAGQAALAATDPSDRTVSLRFEAFLGGRELANGYLELTDAVEQQERLREDQRSRVEAGGQLRPIDERLIAALEAGLPACAGVALGIDRLLMHHMGVDDISQVLAFDWTRA